MVGIVIVITIMPLRFLVSFGKGHGSAWHQAGVVKCSTAEDTMGMVCTSIPTFRQMLAPSLPSLFASNGLQRVHAVQIMYIRPTVVVESRYHKRASWSWQFLIAKV